MMILDEAMLLKVERILNWKSFYNRFLPDSKLMLQRMSFYFQYDILEFPFVTSISHH